MASTHLTRWLARLPIAVLVAFLACTTGGGFPR